MEFTIQKLEGWDYRMTGCLGFGHWLTLCTINIFKI